jgi:glycosyltransferase involved in cell wall biosynthesis
MHPRISIVVPLYNEEANVALLVDAVADVMNRAGESWELILVDDGSSDGTSNVIEALAAADHRVRHARLARNYGQTTAMQAGFDLARGGVVVSMDGDLQNDPEDIPRLVAKLDQGYDLVAGYRVRRQDALIRRKLPSWVANLLIRRITRVSIRDNGCSLKAFRRSTLDRMKLYSDMHRFLPAVAVATAGARVAEMPVRHHARRYGQSKYGLSRIYKVASDLLTITLITWFRERPLYLFGIGTLTCLVMSVIFGIGALVGFSGHTSAADAYVLPAASLLWLVLACFLLLAGLISEVALHRSRQEQDELPPLVAERLL